MNTSTCEEDMKIPAVIRFVMAVFLAVLAILEGKQEEIDGMFILAGLAVMWLWPYLLEGRDYFINRMEAYNEDRKKSNHKE